MSARYIEINKADLTLAFAWLAAVFAWYAWKEASSASFRAKSKRDPITVTPAEEETNSEETDE